MACSVSKLSSACSVSDIEQYSIGELQADTSKLIKNKAMRVFFFIFRLLEWALMLKGHMIV